MIRRAGLLIAAFLLLIPATLTAGTRSCTAGMVTLGICRTTADVAYCLPIGTVDPDGGGPLLAPSATIADAFASLYNWQSPAPCTQDMISAGICSSGQIGTLVAVTRAQFADMQVKLFIRDTMRRYLKQQAVSSAAASSDALADPDLGQ